MTVLSNEKLDQMMEAIQRVEEDLRDYHWMTEEIATYYKVNETLKDKKEINWEGLISISTNKFGLEAAMPKAVGSISDVTFREAKKLLRQWERIKRYEKKVKRLDEAVSKLSDERERIVAEGLMDGEKLYKIAQQLDVSRRTIHDIKQSMIRKLAIELYGDEIKSDG